LIDTGDFLIFSLMLSGARFEFTTGIGEGIFPVEGVAGDIRESIVLMNMMKVEPRWSLRA